MKKMICLLAFLGSWVLQSTAVAGVNGVQVDWVRTYDSGVAHVKFTGASSTELNPSGCYYTDYMIVGGANSDIGSRAFLMAMLLDAFKSNRVININMSSACSGTPGVNSRAILNRVQFD